MMEAVSNRIVKNEKISRKTRKIKQFYDRDLGVAWGPVSLEEIKDDFKCAQTEINKRLLPKTNPQSIIEANERSKSLEFVNVEQVVEASVPEISAYLTASVQVGTLGNTSKSSEYFSTVELRKSTSNKHENTYLDFVHKALNTTRDDIENEYQILVEETVNNDDKSSFNGSCNSFAKISSISISEGRGMADDINLPSTDHNDSVYNEDISLAVEETDENSHFTEDYSREEAYNNEIAYFAKDIENIETNEETSLDDSLFPRSMSPPISIPEIDLHQFDNSCGSPLNDTLDRIDAILQQDEIFITDLRTERNFECHSDNSDNIANDSNEKPITRTNIISASFLQKTALGVEVGEPIRIVKTPVKILTNIKTTPSSKVTPNLKNVPKIVENGQNSHIPVFKKTPDCFKVPNSPYYTRETNKLKANHLKDIVSPVRMYIKYSPQPVLKQNVNLVGKTNLKAAQKVSKSKNKENRSELPNVMYKPSKKQILSSDESMHLPGSIDKFVKKCAVIKHEGRQMSQRGLFLDETLDAEAELTKSFLSDCSSISEINSNISILHKKRALRE